MDRGLGDGAVVRFGEATAYRTMVERTRLPCADSGLFESEVQRFT